MGGKENGISNQFYLKDSTYFFLLILLFILDKVGLVVTLTICFCISVPFLLIYLFKFNCGMDSFSKSTYYLLKLAKAS